MESFSQNTNEIDLQLALVLMMVRALDMIYLASEVSDGQD